MHRKLLLLILLCSLLFVAVLTGCSPERPQTNESDSVTTELYEWKQHGPGDCEGHDDPKIIPTDGSEPNDDYAKKGYTAVCWTGEDGKNNTNRDGEAWCTYKEIDYRSCIEGDNEGTIYKPVDISIEAHESGESE